MRTEAGSFHSEELFPNKFIKHLLLPHNSQQQTKRCYRDPPLSDVGGRGGCQDMLRWSGQNANQKVGPDKMPTTEKKSRTKCQPRLAFCPVGISSGWHFVHTPTCSGCPVTTRPCQRSRGSPTTQWKGGQ